MQTYHKSTIYCTLRYPKSAEILHYSTPHVGQSLTLCAGKDLLVQLCVRRSFPVNNTTTNQKRASHHWPIRESSKCDTEHPQLHPMLVDVGNSLYL